VQKKFAETMKAKQEVEMKAMQEKIKRQEMHILLKIRLRKALL